MPRITIVTPSYQQGRWLERSIRSVLDQGYPNLEYMVLDGGSTDASVGIIERYGDRLARWSSGPDGGQAAAVDAGWRSATGEILGWLNSDDFYLPGTLELVGRWFADHPDRGFVYGRCRLVDPDGASAGHDRQPVQPGRAAVLAPDDPAARRVPAARAGRAGRLPRPTAALFDGLRPVPSRGGARPAGLPAAGPGRGDHPSGRQDHGRGRAGDGRDAGAAAAPRARPRARRRRAPACELGDLPPVACRRPAAGGPIPAGARPARPAADGRPRQRSRADLERTAGRGWYALPRCPRPQLPSRSSAPATSAW